mgnify:CR=1 FL=1
MPSAKYSQKRQDIIDTALRLFNQYGYVSVGVDRIIAESGVAKMTFYKFFPTKNDLIKETLITRDQMIRETITKAVHDIAIYDNSKTPHLDALFNWYANWFNSEDFYGCMFIKANDEFVDSEDFNNIIRQHKDWLIHKIVDVLKKDNINANEAMATQISLLLDGATINKSIYKNSDALSDSQNLISEILIN